MDEAKIIETFHLNWNNFPEVVKLTRKDKTVVATNKAGIRQGIQLGSNCCDELPLEKHKGCMADEAIKTGECIYDRKITGENDLIRFWIPLCGAGDYYLHFLIGFHVKLDPEYYAALRAEKH